MAKDVPKDPMILEPGSIAFHQLLTFAPGPLTLADSLHRSPMFALEMQDRGARADWIQFSPEGEISPFPFGRITVHPRGLLLETFSEERLHVFRRCVEDLGVWKVTADQVRVFRVPDAIERPAGLLQPLHELAGRKLEEREVAIDFLRMAWPFFPREDLDGRTPHTVVRTGRGRAALASILPLLPAELERDFRGFPVTDPEELREILLPEELPVPAETPEEKPHPVDERRRS